MKRKNVLEPWRKKKIEEASVMEERHLLWRAFQKPAEEREQNCAKYEPWEKSVKVELWKKLGLIELFKIGRKPSLLLTLYAMTLL